jgi:aerobic-type carbon monoxide dehydrogenase small subunit (CoxS/CutS family)
MLIFELGAGAVAIGGALVTVLPPACVWAAGGDVTAMRPGKDVVAAALPPLRESELTDNGFCAAGKIICGYCVKGNIMKTVHYLIKV